MSNRALVHITTSRVGGDTSSGHLALARHIDRYLAEFRTDVEGFGRREGAVLLQRAIDDPPRSPSRIWRTTRNHIRFIQLKNFPDRLSARESAQNSVIVGCAPVDEGLKTGKLPPGAAVVVAVSLSYPCVA